MCTHRINVHTLRTFMRTTTSNHSCLELAPRIGFCRVRKRDICEYTKSAHWSLSIPNAWKICTNTQKAFKLCGLSCQIQTLELSLGPVWWKLCSALVSVIPECLHKCAQGYTNALMSCTMKTVLYICSCLRRIQINSTLI